MKEQKLAASGRERQGIEGFADPSPRAFFKTEVARESTFRSPFDMFTSRTSAVINSTSSALL